MNTSRCHKHLKCPIKVRSKKEFTQIYTIRCHEYEFISSCFDSRKSHKTINLPISMCFSLWTIIYMLATSLIHLKLVLDINDALTRWHFRRLRSLDREERNHSEPIIKKKSKTNSTIQKPMFHQNENDNCNLTSSSVDPVSELLIIR